MTQGARQPAGACAGPGRGEVRRTVSHSWPVVAARARTLFHSLAVVNQHPFYRICASSDL